MNGYPSRWQPYFWVAVALLPILMLRDFTPANELRYLSIADEAIENHTFFAFTNHGEAYADKPPLYLWIVMAGKWIFGRHLMWFLGLFSLIPAFIIAEVMDRWSGRELQPAFRTDAKLMLLSCGLFAGMAVVLRMDMLMTMFIVLPLYTFFRMTEGNPPRGARFLFPLYVFLAVFSKGPMGILIPLAVTLVYLLSKGGGAIRTFGRYWGWRTWALLIPLCAVWFGAVYAEGGTAYLDNLLFRQTMGRAVNSFHHKAPFYFYLTRIWYTFLPWALLVFGTVIFSFTRKVKFRHNTDRFFLIAGMTTLVLLSFISSKIDVYLLPAYPFFCYLAAIYVSRYSWNRWMALALAIPTGVLTVAVVAVWWISGRQGMEMLRHWEIYTAAALISLAAIISLICLYRRKDMHLAIRSLSCGLFAALFVAGFALPSLNDSMGYTPLADAASKLAGENAAGSYTVWNVPRGDNFDVYFGRDASIDLVEADTLTLAPQTPVILLTRASNLTPELEKKAAITGKFAAVCVRDSLTLIKK